MGKNRFKTILILVIVAAAAIVSYFYFNSKQESRLVSDKTGQNMVGNDRDEHNCIGSAGYSWCEAKKSCLRVWESYCTAAAPKKTVFKCSGSKTVTATFYPSDDKYVDLHLSDGRDLSIPRATSASGARYAKDDESFVFWNKGETAFVTENGATTFSNCLLSPQ